MSGNFTGRRAPNVSAYLANLNTVPTAQDLAAQNEFDMGQDGLDFMTNIEFFDFDHFVPDLSQQPAQNEQKPQGVNGSAYNQYGEFQTFPTSISDSPMTYASVSPTGVPTGAYPPTAQQLQQAFQQQPQTGGKRKSLAADLTPTAELEDSSRMAAEEDKRRRNTAASARFRVKKKQREMALEKSTKEMTDKVQALESKVQQLEMENKWLKELITDKGDAKTVEAKLHAKAGERASVESSTETRNDGVGTDAKSGVKA